MGTWIRGSATPSPHLREALQMTTQSTAEVLQGPAETRSLGWRSLHGTRRFVRRKPLGAFGGLILLLLVSAALLADVLAPYGAAQQDTGAPLSAPSASHLAGTDQYGRDIFSRLLYGARISLYVGIGATVLSIVPATVIGVASAYFQGRFDYIVQRVVDAVQAVPGLILLIAIVVVLGPSVVMVVASLSVRSAVVNSRVMRGATIQIMGRDFIQAARSLGARDLRLMLRHVLPNIAAPIIIVASLGFGQFILAEASLSFLGYGVPPPEPSWGGMLASDGRNYMYAAPHMFVGPALVLSLVVFGVNMFGDAMRDVLDPRLRGASGN
ncbi:MAG: ABC transporter permease subunit [Dehalococcoidia bacterium]|nr:ABC transporter permease subunit [Dehalococcoidia bacterium]